MTWLEIFLAIWLYFATYFVTKRILHSFGLHKIERFLGFYLLPVNIVFAIVELIFTLGHRVWLQSDCRRNREAYFRKFFDFDPFPISAEKQEKVARKLARDLGDLCFWDFTWHRKTKHERDVPTYILTFVSQVLAEIRRDNSKQDLVAGYCGYPTSAKLDPPIYSCE